MTNVTAPINGKIVKLNVAVGDAVRENQSLLVFEAMKMEMDLPSPISGKISGIRVAVGQSVDAEAILLEIE